MKQSIKNIFLLLATVVYTQAFAQDFTATVSSKKVGVNERFRLTYVVRNKNIEKLVLPQLSDFTIVGGPYQSTSTSIVNNNYSMSSSIAYDLVCGKTGKYIIGGGTLKSGGQSFTSNSIEIEITKEPQQKAQQQPARQDPFAGFFGQQQQQSQQPQTQSAPPAQISKSDLFIVASLNKTTVYPGEPVTVYFKLYSKFPQVQFDEIKFPEYKDAWTSEIKESGTKEFKAEVYNGQRYYTAIIKNALFIPQKVGDIDVKAVTASVLVQFRERTGNMWEDLFGGRLRQEKLNVTGNSVKLKVKEFPEINKPESFNGATGDFNMEVKTDFDSIAVNDAVTIKVTLSGSGNLNLMPAPVLKFPPVFEVFDPKSSESVSVKPGNVTGTKTFEYLVIPRSPGKYKLAPVEFSYFNPKTEKYNTLSSDSLSLKVTGNASEGTVVDASGRVSGNLTDDIRYLKTDIGGAGFLPHFFPSFRFFFLFALLLMATVVLWFLRTKIWDLRNDTDRKKIRVADSVAVKRLRKAEAFLNKGNKAEFYEECYKAVIQYLQDRKGLELTSISGEKVKAFLAGKNVSPELCAEAAAIIAVCELARFAPPGTASELSDFHHRCIRFISTMEKK